ncbi:unnamed protein product [Closterium sp. NIES-54]
MKGFMQVYGTDYDKTYAPVSSYVMLRIFLSIIAVLDLNLMQLDMKNAFLQSKLDRVLYTHQPDYFNNGTGRVCKLLKSHYGLNQSPLLWYRALNGVLLGAGSKKSRVDKALYFKVGDEKRQKVGSLQFAATLTRPDIAFACSKLGSGLTMRSDQHWREVDRCLAYLANTRDTALEFGGGAESLKLVDYVDTDDASNKQHRTSTNQSRQGGFAPSTADPSLFLRTDTSLPPFYVLVYVDDLVFATADTEALILVKSELQKRHTCTNLGEMRSYLGLQITWDRARRTITITQSHMVHQVLQRFSFQFSSPQPTPLSTGHSLSAPPSDESVELSSPYPELVGCLMYLMTCTRPDLVYPLSLLARYVAPGRHPKVHWDAAKRVLRYFCTTQRSSQGYTFSLGSDSVSWRSTRWSSVLSSSCEAEIYAGAMAAQELRWLTYLLTDLGEQPRSPPVLYVDNKAMIALCQEHRLEHRMKPIALRYFLA